MQRREDLLVHGLYRDGPDVVVAARFQDPFGVGAIGLVASDVRSDVMRRKKHHAVAELVNLAGPVMGGSAGFHDHGRRWLLGHEGQELVSPRAFPANDVAGSLRDRYLEHGLCHIHGDASIVRHDGLLLCLNSSDSGTSMPTESQEESISSLPGTRSGASAPRYSRLGSLRATSHPGRNSSTPPGLRRRSAA